MEKQTLAQWLEACGAFDVRECTVAIKSTNYQCALYKQTLSTPEHSTAWARGEREYTREMLYCLGAVPPCRKRTSKLCFRFIGDSRDWYLAGHVPAEAAVDSKYAEFHPFGEAFQLAPWSVPDGTAIDHYEPKPYVRVGASVDYR